MKTLLAIDTPAHKETSEAGITYLSYEDTKPIQVKFQIAVTGGFDGFTEWVREHEYLVNTADTVVCETYVVYNKDGDPSPMLSEGLIRYLRPDTVLSPSTGKNTAVPDTLLKNLGLYIPGGHHRDATESARHAVRWLRMQKHIPTLKTPSK